MDKRISYAFPTPIGEYRLSTAEADEMNRELQRIILERERVEPTQIHSNAGGWHSQRDLLDWPDSAIRVFRNRLHEAVDHAVECGSKMIPGTPPPKEGIGDLVVRAWANVNRRGNYHRVHNHPRASWSGVYYVSAGTDAPDHPLSGMLELMDPRPFTEMVPVPGEPFGRKLMIKPETGKIIMFPSWMYHCVNPYHGEGERISIAFNVFTSAPY